MQAKDLSTAQDWAAPYHESLRLFDHSQLDKTFMLIRHSHPGLALRLRNSRIQREIPSAPEETRYSHIGWPLADVAAMIGALAETSADNHAQQELLNQAMEQWTRLGYALMKKTR